MPQTQDEQVLREADLSALVARHRRRFHWYDALVQRQGADDGAHLADLPIIDERLLLEHYYDASPAGCADALSYQTSGTSTGRRKTVLYSHADHASYCAQRARLFGEFLADIPPGGSAVSDLGTGHAAASAAEIFRRIGFEHCEVDFRLPIAEHVTLLNRAQPDVFFTMPVILDQLLARGDDLQIGPRKVIVVGDVAPANWRQHVARSFGIDLDDILDIVGSIEVGAIAHYSAATGLYHFHHHILPEAVEPQLVLPEGAPALSEGQGLLLLTSFAREYFPAIRYATTDVVNGLRRIRWQGRDVHVCDRLDGRIAGDVKHGERLSCYEVCAAVNEAFPGRPFEVVEDGGIEIRVGTERVTAEDEAVVVNYLMTASPDVRGMIEAGLVRPIVVTAVALDQLRSSCGKRFFRAGRR